MPRIPLNDGERIIIDVPKDREPSQSPARRKGVVRARSAGDELGRRRLKKGGYLNFYDFGQILVTGNWEDLDYSEPLVFNTPGDWSSGVANPIADYSILRDKILEVPANQWKTRYRKLSFEAAERYGLDGVSASLSEYYPVARNGSRLVFADPTNPIVAGTKWEAGGLKLETIPEDLLFKSYRAFEDFAVGSGRAVKVTETPNYADPEVVGFELAQNADIFLVPKSVVHLGISQDGSNADNLLPPYKHFRRSIWLDSEYETSNYPGLSFDTNAIKSADALAILAAEKAEPGTLALNSNDGSVSFTFIDPDLFPQYSPGFLLFYTGLLGLSAPAAYTHEGDLIGAVQQGGNTYYVWATEDEVADPYTDRGSLIFV